jgi:hypothetical protein
MRSERGTKKAQDKDGERRNSRPRMVRSGGGSHAPFVIAGGAVLVLVVVGVVVGSSKNRANERGPATRAAAPRERPPQAPPQAPPQGANAQSAAAPRTAAAMATRRAASANVSFKIAVDKRATGDQRTLRATCGGCGADLAKKLASCPGCGAQLRWSDKAVMCNFCADPPKVELAADQPKVGFCGVCGGTGKNPRFDATTRLPFGMTADASGARGEECPGCLGSGRCKQCAGRGRFEVPESFGQ